MAWFVGGPQAGAVLLAIAVLFAIAWCNTARIRRERADHSICTFARSFPRRSVDTWILRSVYEQISRIVMFPIRAEDELYDLLNDALDLDSTVEDIAKRARRELGDEECDPAFGKVRTVRDLVYFLDRRPRMA